MSNFDFNPETIKARISFELHPRLGLFCPKDKAEIRLIIKGAGWAPELKETRKAGTVPFKIPVVVCDAFNGQPIWAALALHHLKTGVNVRMIIGVPMIDFDPADIMRDLAFELVKLFDQ